MRRTIFEVARDWCDWLEARDTAPRTVDNYWRYLLAAGFIAQMDPRDFTERDVVRVMTSYPPKGGGRQMSLRAMRSFFAWAEDGELLVNPARRITVPRSKLGPAARLSREQLEAIWSEALLIDPRAKPALVLLYYTGARVGSLAGVEVHHVRRDRQGRVSIHFAVAKGDRPYEVPIEAPEALEAIERLMELRSWRPKMAVARRPTLVGVGEGVLWRWVKRAAERAGVEASPHTFRHTFASDLAQDPQVDVRTWTELMNHQDASQLRRYAAAAEPRMRSAVRRLGDAHLDDDDEPASRRPDTASAPAALH